MRRRYLRNLVVYLLLGLALAAQPGGRSDSPELLLERAIQKQTVDGDLKAAIEIYKKILERAGRSRTVEAKALLRLGQCQEKLGQSEAVKAYERLARDYADQATEASAARARLRPEGLTWGSSINPAASILSSRFPRNCLARRPFPLPGQRMARCWPSGFSRKRVRRRSESRRSVPALFRCCPNPIMYPEIEFLRDGRSLVLAGLDRQARPVIGLLDIRTGQWTPLKESDNRATRCFDIAVSPDGKYLYFADTRITYSDSGNILDRRIVRLDRASREERTVLDPGGPFSLSPDGGSIAFVNEGSVQVFNLGDGSSRKVAQSVGSAPAWSADGRSILFQKSLGELWRVPSEGGDPVRVALLKTPFNQLKIHPDGRQIAIVGGRQSAELWVADNLLSVAKVGAR